MTNEYKDISTEIEVELPGEEDSTIVSVHSMVCHSRWEDESGDDWCEDVHVLFHDGRGVPKDLSDYLGRKVWHLAEQAALDASYH